jgi:hypothetical protein
MGGSVSTNVRDEAFQAMYHALKKLTEDNEIEKAALEATELDSFQDHIWATFKYAKASLRLADKS